MKIPVKNLRWYAAFHNESHHPHVHLIMYSSNPKEGYLTKQGLENLRSSFARDIFKQDLISVYEKQTEHRDMLKVSVKDIIAGIVASINADEFGNETIDNLLKQLAEKLSRTSGKKVYGYLKPDVKNLIDNIVRELSSDERIAGLYDLWYEQKEETVRTYTDHLPERVPLVDNKEFKSIKNQIIKEALKLNPETTEDDELVSIPPYYSDDDVDLTMPTVITPTPNTQISPKPRRKHRFFAPSISLLRYLCGIIQNRIRENKDREYEAHVDRKIRRKIEDKKHGLGLH